MTWQPIESAPKDGARVLVLRGGHASFNIWKTNHMVALCHEGGGMLECQESYFGDENEWDDYDLAKPENFPTHWMLLPAAPCCARRLTTPISTE